MPTVTFFRRFPHQDFNVPENEPPFKPGDQDTGEFENVHQVERLRAVSERAENVILSAAKDLVSPQKGQILRYAQNDRWRQDGFWNRF